jgi:hypothetical protein
MFMQMWKMRGRRRDRMWDVRLVLVIAFAAAVLVASIVFYTGWDVLGVNRVKQEKTIDASTLFDLVKLAFGVVAGAGALVALIVAYRRQRIDEDGALREHTRLHTERFTTAVTQIGDDSPAVKLGGVHALAGLADDAPTPELRQTCIDVLCAFLRLPYTAESDLSPGDETVRHDYLALREVRHTVIRLIRDHLRLPEENPHSWRGAYLDFTGVTFDGGDFSGSIFKDGTVTFDHAKFQAGRVSFERVQCKNSILNFDRAHFCGAEVDFGHVHLGHDAWMGFDAAVFSSGVVTFRGMVITEGARVSFRATVFNGGIVALPSITVEGGIYLNNVSVRGSLLDFSGAEITGELHCGGAVFGTAGGAHTVVSFDDTLFAGCLADVSAYCGPGVVQWHNVLYDGGLVSFEDASGEPPVGLLLPGEPLPEELVVPPAWQVPAS